MKTTTTSHTHKTIANINAGSTLKPQKAIEGPSLVRKIVSLVPSVPLTRSVSSTRTLKQHPVSIDKPVYTKLATIHVSGGVEWLIKHGYSYNSSVQPIFAIDKGIIHSIVLYPTVIVSDSSLLLCKNVRPEGIPTPENVIATVKINVVAEELPTPVLILEEQLADSKLLLDPSDRLSIYSTTDITGIDIEVNILY